MKLEVYILINRYKKILDERLAKAKAIEKPGAGHSWHPLNRTNIKKRKILRFFKIYGRWPKRTSTDVRERSFGMAFENYVSKQCVNYDRALRRVAIASGRVSNHKRPHDPVQFKLDILEFIKTNGRVPRRYREGGPLEGNLRCKLEYYTQEKNDMTFLGQVYEVDKCHKSGIPTRFRRFLNNTLDIEKPLIRLIRG